MLDEIDKLGMDFRGDPASALLEVLDPEQNNSFQDHYLDVPFDLSKVMFITTANLLDPIPAPLRDRMEVIELAGYTDEEKLEIARRHLIPKQVKENGLTPEQIVFTDERPARPHPRLHARGRTAQSGTRDRRPLPQGAPALSPKEIWRRWSSTRRQIRKLLGPEKHVSEVAERSDEPGVATGLVWTPMGGDIVFIEAIQDARQEGSHHHRPSRRRDEGVGAGSAQSHPLARREAVGIDGDFFDELDIHIHVPAGAVPKDGPSAGVTIATALTSLLTGRRVRHDIAMTGEITLRGKVLPVGGIKEKVLGARRAGIAAVILPRRNEKDLEDIPAQIRNTMRFHFVDTVDQVFDLALEPARPTPASQRDVAAAPAEIAKHS